jgi:ABC-2 type transport system ATP-binding protein
MSVRPALLADRLGRTYGAREALHEVSFAVPPGQVVAVLGPNGAGKTTLLALLAGFVAPTSGRVEVLATDPARADRWWRARIGLVLQSSSLDGSATVGEWLDVIAAAYPNPMPRAELLELVDLAEAARRRIATLSGGQPRRVDLATALVGRPAVLFLDEPTSGLDPEARRRIWTAVERLSDAGTTVLLSSHYLDEADQLADRLLVLSAGRLIADTTPARLRAAGGPPRLRRPTLEEAYLALTGQRIGPLDRAREPA